MRQRKLEKTSFIALGLSLFFILVYLALAVESARAGGEFWEHSHRAVRLVSESAMRGLLLTAILGLGFDMYTKN